jgi:hypothetical protein
MRAGAAVVSLPLALVQKRVPSEVQMHPLNWCFAVSVFRGCTEYGVEQVQKCMQFPQSLHFADLTGLPLLHL